MEDDADLPSWLFGYGSIIWRPDFTFEESRVATLSGYCRRFWQGSHDHRGTPEAPGRVVTLVRNPAFSCVGMAFRLAHDVRRQILVALDHREKNGYERRVVELSDERGMRFKALTYLAPPNNFAWLGPASIAAIAEQIAVSEGPSGRNDAYLHELANALTAMRIQDEHISDLDQQVRAFNSRA